MDTVIDWVVAPLDQAFPDVAEDVNVTLPPSQNVVALEAEIVGVAAAGFTVTVISLETADGHVPLFT